MQGFFYRSLFTTNIRVTCIPTFAQLKPLGFAVLKWISHLQQQKYRNASQIFLHYKQTFGMHISYYRQVMGTAFTLVSPSTSTLSSTAKSTSRLTHPHDIANTPQKARDPVKGLKPSAQPATAFQTIEFSLLLCICISSLHSVATSTRVIAKYFLTITCP